MIREKIKQILKKALKDAREIKIEYPSDEKFGDYATNIAFVLAKAESKSPREFAESLVSKISGNKKTREIFEKAEAAGSGFINWPNFYVLISAINSQRLIMFPWHWQIEIMMKKKRR